MSQYTTRPLDMETWDAFARLCDQHNGAGFGCWCTWFHPRRTDHDGVGSDTLPGVPRQRRDTAPKGP
jgi:hypothetical protein